MAELIRIADIAELDGKEVQISGWLYNKRSSGKIHFLQVRDGSATVQCVVFKGEVDPSVFEAAGNLTQESSVQIEGTVRADDRSSLGYEIGVTRITIVHEAGPYPITPKEHGIAFLLDHRHLWLRSSRQHTIIRIRSTIIKACRDYFDENDFVLVDAPIFTPNACEGTTTLFETDYFGEKAYLTQSGQLYAEAAAMAFGKVYCFGPTFRAEKSKTRRHLTEFWMIEPEVAYMDLDGAMDLAEDFLVHVVSRVLEKHRADLISIERDVSVLEKIQKPFPRVSYTDAIVKLAELGVDHELGKDFGADEETVLSKSFDRPIIVHRYPSEIKAFYLKADPDDPKHVLCMDVLAPEGYGEIIGGGQREDDLGILERKIGEHDLFNEAFSWYLDLRRYGSVPHAGFGMGIERTVAWLCGLPHVRETIPFPRMLQRLSP
jgi:asparaginyl-tRNA synthetase